jgi:hypothetical protein
MGRKRGRGRGSFVSDTMQQSIDFYREIVQDLRSWTPQAPKLPAEPAEDPDPPPSPEPPAFSSPETRQPGEGSPPDAHA